MWLTPFTRAQTTQPKIEFRYTTVDGNGTVSGLGSQFPLTSTRANSLPFQTEIAGCTLNLWKTGVTEIPVSPPRRRTHNFRKYWYPAVNLSTLKKCCEHMRELEEGVRFFLFRLRIQALRLLLESSFVFSPWL